MNRIKLVTLVIIITSISIFAGKNDDIRTVLKLSGSAKIGIQLMDQMIQTFKTSMPTIPSEFWDEFRKEIDANEIIELIVPIYDKHFSHDEIKALIKFYKSAIGKKLVEKQPLIVQESYAIGQKWGEQLGSKVEKKLKEKGYQ